MCHMQPGDVFYFSSNSFVLCVDQTNEKKVITPKTPSLNPNADVFHSLSPTMPPEFNTPTPPWPELQAHPSTISSLPSHLSMNGDLSSGGAQTGLLFPSTPESSIGSDYGAMNGRLEAPGALFASDARATDDVGPLEDFVEPGQLRTMLRRQLEYYFSRENLTSDAYLVSQMDADQFVPITTVASFNQVKRLTRNMELVIEVLRESANVQVDAAGEKVRPLHKRCIVILREIPDSTPIQEVEKLFAGDSCPKFLSCQFAHNNSWYITFDTEEDAHGAYRYLREELKTFLGMPIMARIKAKPLLRSSYGSKETNVDFSPSNVYQPQPTFSYSSPVPSIQYIPPQSLPFFTPHATMSPVWSTSVVYYDPGMAFAANGYIPTATFTPPPPGPPPAPCSSIAPDLQSPRMRGSKMNRFLSRQSFLDHGDTGDHNEYQFRGSWPQSGSRIQPDSEFHGYDQRRQPRYGGGVGGAMRTPSRAGPRPDFFRNNGKPPSPRAGMEYHGPVVRNPLGASRSSYGSRDNDVFHYGNQNQDHDTISSSAANSEAVVSSSTAATQRDVVLPPRPGGVGYKSRRRSRPSIGDASKTAGSGKETVQTSAIFELEEKFFPPLPGAQVMTTPPGDKFQNKISDVVRGTARIQIADRNSSKVDRMAQAFMASSDAESPALHTSTAVAASSFDKEPASSAVDSSTSLPNSPQRNQKRIMSESGTGSLYSIIATSANFTSSQLTSPSDEEGKSSLSSLRLSYAQMALRGKEKQENRMTIKGPDNQTSYSAAPNASHFDVQVVPLSTASSSVVDKMKRTQMENTENMISSSASSRLQRLHDQRRVIRNNNRHYSGSDQDGSVAQL